MSSQFLPLLSFSIKESVQDESALSFTFMYQSIYLNIPYTTITNGTNSANVKDININGIYAFAFSTKVSGNNN